MSVSHSQMCLSTQDFRRARRYCRRLIAVDRHYNTPVVTQLLTLAVRVRKMQKCLYRADAPVHKSRVCEAIADQLASTDNVIQFYHAAADFYREAVR
jgi:hypothetical protein